MKRNNYEYTTIHGLQRTMERAMLNEEDALELIRNAWLRGKSLTELPNSIQKYFRNKFNYDNGDEGIYYENYCFLLISMV